MLIKFTQEEKIYASNITENACLIKLTANPQGKLWIYSCVLHISGEFINQNASWRNKPSLIPC